MLALIALLRRKSLWLAVVPALMVAATARSVTVPDLYETAQPVEGSREAAFVDALKTVVVRVSGQRDAVARLGAQLNNPRKYVQRFSFTAAGVLEVGFDSASVDQLLIDAGLPVWGRERPATLVMLMVEDRDGTVRAVSPEQSSPERDAISRVARQRGLPLKWPGSHERMAAPADLTAAMQVAARYGANAVLLGNMRAGFARWTLLSSEGVSEVTGSLEDGVHLASDTFARVFAATGSSLGTVLVEVTGIGNLEAYAATLNYLENMTLVRGVQLEQVSGETLRFRLAVRGDAATLRRAIALDNRLVPVGTADANPAVAGADPLAFRYRP
jgi:uncharacterized protein